MHMKTKRCSVNFFLPILMAILGIGSMLSAQPAEAAYVITLDQVGPNVVATGSGTLDLSSLIFVDVIQVPASMEPSQGVIWVGPSPYTFVSVYNGLVAGALFGPGFTTFADAGTGDKVGTDSLSLEVPAGYISGAPLSSTSTYD